MARGLTLTFLLALATLALLGRVAQCLEQVVVDLVVRDHVPPHRDAQTLHRGGHGHAVEQRTGCGARGPGFFARTAGATTGGHDPGRAGLTVVMQRAADVDHALAIDVAPAAEHDYCQPQLFAPG